MLARSYQDSNWVKTPLTHDVLTAVITIFRWNADAKLCPFFYSVLLRHSQPILLLLAQALVGEDSKCCSLIVLVSEECPPTCGGYTLATCFHWLPCSVLHLTSGVGSWVSKLGLLLVDGFWFFIFLSTSSHTLLSCRPVSHSAVARTIRELCSFSSPPHKNLDQ